jgi:hypothetical protein
MAYPACSAGAVHIWGRLSCTQSCSQLLAAWVPSRSGSFACQGCRGVFCCTGLGMSLLWAAAGAAAQRPGAPGKRVRGQGRDCYAAIRGAGGNGPLHSKQRRTGVLVWRLGLPACCARAVGGRAKQVCTIVGAAGPGSNQWAALSAPERLRGTSPRTDRPCTDSCRSPRCRQMPCVVAHAGQCCGRLQTCTIVAQAQEGPFLSG